MRKIQNIKSIYGEKSIAILSNVTKLMILSTDSSDVYLKYADKTDPDNKYIECHLIPDDNSIEFENDNISIHFTGTALIVYAAPQLLPVGVWSDAATYRYDANEIDDTIVKIRNRDLILNNINIADTMEDSISTCWSSYNEEVAEAFAKDPEREKILLRNWFTRKRDPGEDEDGYSIRINTTGGVSRKYVDETPPADEDVPF